MNESDTQLIAEEVKKQHIREQFVDDMEDLIEMFADKIETEEDREELLRMLHLLEEMQMDTLRAISRIISVVGNIRLSKTACDPNRIAFMVRKLIVGLLNQDGKQNKVG